SAISSGSLEQSLPAAALRSCRMRGQREANMVCVRTYSPSSLVSRENRVKDKVQRTENSSLQSLTLRSILAKPRALDARSLASWNSSLSDRLVSITDRLGKNKKAVLSSALSQNSLPLFCRPASRNSPVDFSSIPAMSLFTYQKSFPDWASPPRI
uniref:Uncharacterized protein n=1 Tax=Stegastes partitus TaxID=144197 RepID=A0A3B4ZM28_9TELE